MENSSQETSGNQTKIQFDSAVYPFMLQKIPFNVMHANKEGNIVYINEKSLDTLRKIEESLPVSVDSILGGSYDVFHKNPGYQRRLLANPKNLPHRAIIKVGSEFLDLLVTALLDENGEYIGPLLTWDVVTEKLKVEKQNEDYSAVMASLSKSQAFIEFTPDGIVTNANDNFVKTLGYGSAEEIKGKHHSIFCDPQWVNSPKYKDFWFKLGNGQFDQGQYKRITKDSREVWIQATYNPVIDSSGKVTRVVKFAVDISKQKQQGIHLVSSLSETASQLSEAAKDLSAIATQMKTNASTTADKSGIATVNSEKVAKGVQSVATNTEEMVASVKEISKSSSEAAGISKEALKKANETNATITQLGDASREIGNVIKVISSIAQQTNLLALNATIEAARAGDAGKGFAVVANEVKELAKQTAKATEDITNKIGSIQQSSKAAILAIGDIGKVIEQINGISMTIAAAVEEQTATTNDVSRIMRESSSAVDGITEVVKAVALAAGESSIGANQTLDAAKGLSNLAATLNELVSKVDL